MMTLSSGGSSSVLNAFAAAISSASSTIDFLPQRPESASSASRIIDFYLPVFR
jgi:hypothetical protein